MHCTHTWRDRHDWIFVFLSILVYFSSIRSTWHLCWLQFIHQISIPLASLPRTVNWMHFSFYYIKPNQFVISSCRCLMLLLDCCFLRHFSLNTTARILIFSIALTWLICCGSATICMCISPWVYLYCICLCVCWGHFCMIWPFIAVHRAVGYANLQVHASFAWKTLW